MAVYQVGDTVLYGAEGVCRFEGEKEQIIGGKKHCYMILKPIYKKSSTVYVPKDNPALQEKIKRVLSPEEIYELIREIPEEEALWIEDEGERKAKYSRILAGSDRKELMRVIKALYRRRTQQEKMGRKFHLSDERFLKEAESRLHGEFALVLHIDPEQVAPFIQQQIQLQKREEIQDNT